MKIFKYNADAKSTVDYMSGKVKTKPEPWLHIVYVTDAFNNKTYWAIYIWDTRQVVEEGICNGTHDSLIASAHLQHAIDNHTLLVSTKIPAIKATFDNRVFGVNGDDIVAVYDNEKDARAKVGKDKQVRKVVSAMTAALSNPEQYDKC
jgi:tRNA A37 threonylcarbamoyladenosine modification protein TsaB